MALTGHCYFSSGPGYLDNPYQSMIPANQEDYAKYVWEFWSVSPQRETGAFGTAVVVPIEHHLTNICDLNENKLKVTSIVTHQNCSGKR